MGSLGGLVMGSRLKGSDLRAWHRSWTDCGLLGSNGLLGRTRLPPPANFCRERRASVQIKIVSLRGSLAARKAGIIDCARTVQESNVFNPFELSLSEKQIPRFVGNVS